MSTAADEPVIEVAGLDVSLGGTGVLHGIDLRVDAGEMVALLGANGSGKSTLMRSILGILPADAGEVRLFGRPTRRRSAHDRLGMVPQDSADAGSIPATARETVASGLLGSRSWFLRRRDRRVMEALEATGIAHLADRPITRMSGGQRRRVMIARALVRSPELLLLDEPFAGIDLRTQELIAALFRRLSAEGTTILVVLHETAALAEQLTRTVVLDHGRVVHDGPEGEAPELDPGHEHPAPAGPLDECLGQELRPA